VYGSFTCRKATTWDRRHYFPSEGRHAEDFFRPINPTASAGFEPANSGTRGQHANHKTTEAALLVHKYYNRSVIDMQLARTLVWVWCTIIFARFEIVTVTLLDHNTVDWQMVTNISKDCGAFIFSCKSFTASCMCMLILWFFYALVLIGYTVVQLVEALCYKPEGRRFNSWWCHWNFSLTQSFRPHYGPGVHSAPIRNEYQEYFLGVKMAGV
jgi:hypothetical protein